MSGFSSCDCPLPAAISDITPITCPENWGQIQKLILQRRQVTSPFPTFAEAGVGGADLLASWTVLKGASDETKVQSTPFFDTFTIPPTEPITRGGNDNSTLDGIERVVGAGFALASGQFFGVPAAVLKQLKTFNCEELDVYFINEAGKIIGINPTGTEFKGFEVQTFFVGDPGSEGKNTEDKTMFRFNLPYGWRDNAVLVTPSDFNAKTQI